MTPKPAIADSLVVGADIQLRFPIEPAFRNEMGLLSINVPTLEAVAPVGIQPDPLDRHFTLKPGRLTEEERKEKVMAAVLKVDKLETEPIPVKQNNCLWLPEIPWVVDNFAWITNCD